MATNSSFGKFFSMDLGCILDSQKIIDNHWRKKQTKKLQTSVHLSLTYGERRKYQTRSAKRDEITNIDVSFLIPSSNKEGKPYNSWV